MNGVILMVSSLNGTERRQAVIAHGQFAVRYELSQENYEPVVFYGIAATTPEKESLVIPAISSNREFVMSIVDCLNRNEVSFVHCVDVVYDFLCDEFSLRP